MKTVKLIIEWVKTLGLRDPEETAILHILLDTTKCRGELSEALSDYEIEKIKQAKAE